MDTQTTLALPAPAPTPATPATPQKPELPESQLDRRFHEAYRQKLAGRKMQEIADSFGVDRSTVWRWCRQVETEALQQLADEPVFNHIVREANRLTDVEEQAREAALNAKSDRAKVMFLGEARRAAVSRQNLLVTTGIFPKAPEQIYRITANLKPQDILAEDRTEKLPRNEAIGELIDALQRGRRV